MSTIIVCRAISCIFNEDRICTAEKILYDLDEGCLTYEELGDLIDLDDEDDLLDDEDLLDDDDLLLDDDLGLEVEDEDVWQGNYG